MSVETGWITPEHWDNPSYKGGKGHINKKWEDRFFRLKNDSLFWFKDAASETVRGHIPLKGCTIETDSEKTTKYDHCFKLYSKKLDKGFYLCAQDDQDKDNWIKHLKIASSSELSTESAVPANSVGGSGAHRPLMNEYSTTGDDDGMRNSTRLSTFPVDSGDVRTREGTHQAETGSSQPTDRSSFIHDHSEESE